MTATQPVAVRDRIVVGVDGSEPSLQALHWARFMAHATGSTVHAVAAWVPYAGLAWAGAGYAMPPTDWNPEEDARRVLADAIAKAYGSDPPPALKLTVQSGGAAPVLLELSTDARMLVVGSRGHGGFVGLLLGSVSGACAEHARCPVLVVHGTTPPPPS